VNIDRRSVLIGATALATATSKPAQSATNGDRVSQDELDEAILLHSMWRADMDSGCRCMFAARDLSGLKFVGGSSPVDLSGADFTRADLSATVAGHILVHHSSFNGAKLDASRWKHPVFAYADMRRVSAKGAKWGAPGDRDSTDRITADFRHTTLKNADLTGAQICGFFYGSNMGNSSLVEADLSFGDFIGPNCYFDMNFAGARLRGAKLRHCRISQASFLNADCCDADFLGSQFSGVNMDGCRLTGANFKGVEIDRTVFSLDQMQKTDLSEVYDCDKLDFLQNPILRNLSSVDLGDQ
jgi:uncharacterized protein YjbI with pentapeptide repeats